MITVLHVVGNFAPGGAEMGVVRLVHGLDRIRGRGVEHVLVSIGPDLSMQSRLPAGVPCISLGLAGGSKTACLSLGRIFKKFGADLVLVNNLAPWLDVALGAKLAGCPCVEVFHGVESGQLSFSFVRRCLFFLADRLTARVVAVSGPARDKLTSLTGIDADGVILNGVDTDFFSPLGDQDVPALSRQEIGLSERHFVFGCVAGLRPVKDHAGLLRAFAGLLSGEDCPVSDPVLVLAGQGPLADDLCLLAAELGIADRVFFLGQRDDVRDVMRLFDVFVLNSETEGLSYAVLEAMACGLPVLLTSVGSNPSLVRDGGAGILVPPRNQEQLLQAMQAMLAKQDALKEMGQAARQVVLEHYSLKSMLEAYRTLLASLCVRQG